MQQRRLEELNLKCRPLFSRSACCSYEGLSIPVGVSASWAGLIGQESDPLRLSIPRGLINPCGCIRLAACCRPLCIVRLALARPQREGTPAAFAFRRGVALVFNWAAFTHLSDRSGAVNLCCCISPAERKWTSLDRLRVPPSAANPTSVAKMFACPTACPMHLSNAS